MTIHQNISEINIEQWTDLVEKSPFSSFFQTKACYDFYSSLSFLEPFVFGVSENENLVGLICGYIIADGGRIKRFFSRRAIAPGGLLLDKNISDEALQTLLNFTSKILKNKAIYVELRNYGDYSDFRPTVEKSGFAYQPHLNFHIQTDDVDSAFKQLSSTKRRDVRSSQKEGAELKEITQEKDLKNFYELLSDLYKTKVKTPLFPYDFFQKLRELPDGKIFGVFYQGNIIGGSACVCLKNKAVYEWFVCGLDGKFKNIYPSTVSTWMAIEYSASHEYKYFDMMGAGKPDESYGVRDFKAKFGGELVEHGRFLYILRPNLYKLGKKVIQKMKRKK